MCLILFSFKQHPKFSLILAANRDEYYNRPTEALKFWKDEPSILAGRDLVGGGTWLGITTSLRFAAITNFRDFSNIKANAPSRGDLVRNFLCGKESPEVYLQQVQKTRYAYNGFNLLIGEKDKLWYYSNHRNTIQKLSSGYYGLSNHFLDTPWPKVKKAKSELKPVFSQPKIDVDATFIVLEDQTYPPKEQLPDTGVGQEWERILSPIFIHSEIYGTRSSSVLTMEKTGKATFTERIYFTDKDRRTHNTQCFSIFMAS